MSETEEKPEADFEETDAVVLDEDGNPRVKMESLQKAGAARKKNRGRPLSKLVKQLLI